MELRQLSIPGVVEIVPKVLGDERGFFARTLDTDLLRQAGLCADFVQESVAFNSVAGTVRGLHYQAAPCWETKVVSCLVGRVFDVVLDLRPDSPTFAGWAAVELDARRCNAVYIPEGCAHGYQTLADASVVHYTITPAYVANLARGVDPFDLEVGIEWPRPVRAVSERDRCHPALRAYACGSS